MAIADPFPLVHTLDVEGTALFYCDRLGFERGYRFPEEGTPAFLVVGLGGLSLGLVRTEDEEEAGRVDLWLYADDVDGEIERLRAAGATIVLEPGEQEWGERMGAVLDPNGIRVYVGSRR